MHTFSEHENEPAFPPPLLVYIVGDLGIGLLCTLLPVYGSIIQRNKEVPTPSTADTCSHLLETQGSTYPACTATAGIHLHMPPKGPGDWPAQPVNATAAICATQGLEGWLASATTTINNMYTTWGQGTNSCTPPTTATAITQASCLKTQERACPDPSIPVPTPPLVAQRPTYSACCHHYWCTRTELPGILIPNKALSQPPLTNTA